MKVVMIQKSNSNPYKTKVYVNDLKFLLFFKNWSREVVAVAKISAMVRIFYISSFETGEVRFQSTNTQDLEFW